MLNLRFIKRIFKTKKVTNSQTILLPSNNKFFKYKNKFLINKFYTLLKKLVMFFILFIGILLLIFIILDSVLYIKNHKGLGFISFIKQKINNKNKKYHIEFVKGLEKYKILSYPNSIFVFDLNKSFPSDVKKQIELFLAYGNSVYLLPSSTDFSKIKENYKKQLNKLGWRFVGAKTLTDENGLIGLYFVKNNIGLRIYTITNYDIWYEILTKTQALTFLKQRILNIKAKQLSINTNKNKLSSRYRLHLAMVDDVIVNAIKLPEIDAYFLTFYNKQRTPLLRIVPYKKNYLLMDSVNLKSLALQYLQDSNRVLNLSNSYSFRKIKFFDIFKNKKYVPINFLYQDINIDKLKTEYKLVNWYRLEYFTINSNKIHKLYIKQYKNIIWIIDVL